MWLLLAIFAIAWFCNLGYRHLAKSDEGRYAEIPREMVASGDWLTPRLNGFKYFEKPPLQYWATAAAFSVFGQTEWAARLWPGLTGFFGVLLVFWFGSRLLGPPAGLYGAAVVASSAIYVSIGHMLTLDMGLTLFMSASVFSIALAQRDQASEAERRRWMLLAWAAAALAVLSKGLIGIVLPAGAIALYVLVERDWKVLARLHAVSGALLFVAIAAPWFAAVSIVNPEFFRFFFIHEHFERFLTQVHRRDEPAWYFIPVLLAGVLPWILSLFPALWRVRSRLCVLYRVRFEARLLYPADLSGAGAAHRELYRLLRPALRARAGRRRRSAGARPGNGSVSGVALCNGPPSGRSARRLRSLAACRGRLSFRCSRRFRLARASRAPSGRGSCACLRRSCLGASRDIGV
jgi:4-amino-4-deoxy-L-arabinose transferase-like glycosyltransferase